MLNLNIHTAYKTTVVKAPESWNELDAAQLVAAAAVLFSEDDPFVRDVKLTCILCRLKPKQLATFDPEVVSTQLLPLFEWVASSCDLTTQLMPQLRGDHIKWFGPEDYLKNLRFAEFDAAERALHAWHQQPDDRILLWEFVAVLYRGGRKHYDLKLNPDGDIREPYNGNLTASVAARMMKEVPDRYAYAILLWYKGCRAYISERFERIFNAPETDKSEVAGEPAYFGLMRSIAKEGIYGSFADVEQLYLYTALTEMEAAIDEREALEAAMEEARENSKS